jgi:hypothetical protein
LASTLRYCSRLNCKASLTTCFTLPNYFFVYLCMLFFMIFVQGIYPPLFRLHFFFATAVSFGLVGKEQTTKSLILVRVGGRPLGLRTPPPSIQRLSGPPSRSSARLGPRPPATSAAAFRRSGRRTLWGAQCGAYASVGIGGGIRMCSKLDFKPFFILK